MGKISTLGAAFAFAALIFTNGGAAVASEQTDLLDRSARTIEHMKVDPAFERARNMLRLNLAREHPEWDEHQLRDAVLRRIQYESK